MLLLIIKNNIWDLYTFMVSTVRITIKSIYWYTHIINLYIYIYTYIYIYIYIYIVLYINSKHMYINIANEYDTHALI